jgi:hypothetical protein
MFLIWCLKIVALAFKFGQNEEGKYFYAMIIAIAFAIWTGNLLWG